MVTVPLRRTRMEKHCIGKYLNHGLLFQRQIPAENLPEHPCAGGPRRVWGAGRDRAPLQRRHDALAGGHERPRCFLQFLLALTWLSLSSKVLMLGTHGSRLSLTFAAEAELSCGIPLHPGLSVRGFRFL